MPITVQFATNRRLTDTPQELASYSDGLVAPSDPTQITYGTAFVDQVDLTADTVGAITTIQDVSFGRFSDQAVGDLSQGGRDLLVFVHGFDNTFENAITRAAFNREWLAASGLDGTDCSVVAFSWPSRGKLLVPPLPWSGYKSDQQMAANSSLALMSFMANLEPIMSAVRASGRRTTLLVHSMGNYAMAGAIEAWFTHGNGEVRLFDEVILAAADEAWDTFDLPDNGRFSSLPKLAGRVSILYSADDDVLDLSRELNRRARLGQGGPSKAVSYGVVRVDCTTCNDYASNFAASHQYYRRSPRVRGMLAQLMAGVGREAFA